MKPVFIIRTPKGWQVKMRDPHPLLLASKRRDARQLAKGLNEVIEMSHLAWCAQIGLFLEKELLGEQLKNQILWLKHK